MYVNLPWNWNAAPKIGLCWGSTGVRRVCAFLSSLWKQYCCRDLGQLERSMVSKQFAKESNCFVSSGKSEAWLPMGLYPKVSLLRVSFRIWKGWTNFVACLPVEALQSFFLSPMLLHFTKFTGITMHLRSSSQLNLNCWKGTEIVGEQRMRKLTKLD